MEMLSGERGADFMLSLLPQAPVQPSKMLPTKYPELLHLPVA